MEIILWWYCQSFVEQLFTGSADVLVRKRDAVAHNCSLRSFADEDVRAPSEELLNERLTVPPKYDFHAYPAKSLESMTTTEPLQAYFHAANKHPSQIGAKK